MPARCVLCGNPGQADLDLCRGCRNDLSRNLYCCYRCGESFAKPNAWPELCGRCLKAMPNFDETHAPFCYDELMQHLISQLKFHDHYRYARLLGGLLASHLIEIDEKPDIIVPVPLHPRRYRERGFNQALEIARHVGRELAIPIDYRSCRRQRDTRHQIELPARQRQRNLRQAFEIAHLPAYRHVAILDDVMTTGATVNALAGSLKAHGVPRVDIWVCARA